MEYFHVDFPLLLITDTLLLQVISILGLMIIILCLAYFFERRIIELIQETETANKQMLTAIESEIQTKDKLIATISQLKEQKKTLEKTISRAHSIAKRAKN